ncbi:hypothetical protein KFK09_027428 [Dendrobium nobile]|uniref:Endonuclease/exonuclease/phosphatase domain-containing protein n=1 Tax=Dendrobium nobile TaxID=94219 RepID=A0A8T3ABJ1_DENNO|nr:hypothetical protein KFK09_027428 [Dendrobium nobile]
MNPPVIGCWNVRGFNSPKKITACKKLISSHRLDLLCLLEVKINHQQSLDNWFCNAHRLFPHEASCNNFDDSTPGRIWLKWNPATVHFQKTKSSKQFIHGFVSSPSIAPIALTAVYAANSVTDRFPLWKDLASIAEGINGPWIIMGDFNCFKDSKDK